MISDKLKCIFVEVPKTGTTSIRKIIGDPEKPHRKPHMNIYQIARETQKEKFYAYFKFGFVRNPWDRAVSLYERREGLQLKSKMTFDEFIEWMKFSSCTCVHPVPHRYQLDWFVSPHGDVIVDFIGKFENLQDDWERVALKLGINRELPKINVNPVKRRHYTEYYSDKTKKIISERFSVDIEYFGYEFEG